MKAFRIILILSVFYSLFSCSREVSVISGYKKLAKELKTNSNNYTIEDFQEVALEIQNLEQEAESCNFTKEQQKEVKLTSDTNVIGSRVIGWLNFRI